MLLAKTIQFRLTAILSSTWLLCTKNIIPPAIIVEAAKVTLDKSDGMTLHNQTYPNI